MICTHNATSLAVHVLLILNDLVSIHVAYLLFILIQMPIHVGNVAVYISFILHLERSDADPRGRLSSVERSVENISTAPQPRCPVERKDDARRRHGASSSHPPSRAEQGGRCDSNPPPTRS